MTWLGKILTFVVFIGAVVWAYLTVQAYVTGVNWKADRDKYKAAYEALAVDRNAEFNRHQLTEEKLNQLVLDRDETIKGQVKQLTDAKSALARASTETKTLQTAYDTLNGSSTVQQANTQTLVSELRTVRDRNTALEDTQQGLVVQTEKAKEEAVKAKIDAKRLQALVDDNSKRIEDLTTRNAELAAGGGRPGKLLDKQPRPLLANLRGEIVDVQGNLIELDIGIDAGLEVGTVLVVYREEGGGTYLGTAKVTNNQSLQPKKAVLTFTPKNNLPMERLRPEERPKKGDLVMPPTVGTTVP